MKPANREAFVSWLRAAGFVLVVTALVAFLGAFYSRKFNLQTGDAQWIWIDHEVRDRTPIAFFVVRDVDVPPEPPFVRIRIACDADWTLYLNGEEIGGGVVSAAPALEAFDLTDMARKGMVNRFAVALRSAEGVGGLLASIDYAPLRENDVVSDGSWRICREWREGVLSGSVACTERPVVLGAPPLGRWNYPQPRAATRFPQGERVVSAQGEARVVSITRQEIRVIGGTAVASSGTVPATLHDFGRIEGRGRVTLSAPVPAVTPVEIRYVDRVAELDIATPSEVFVFAPGETVVTDTIARSFRFMVVASFEGTVEVVEQESEGR